MELTPGEQYKLSFSLAGENGVGEFFFLKSDDLGNRYDETFTTASGEQTVYIVSESGGVLYFGIQCGTIGNGNSMTLSNVSITPVRSGTDSADQPMMAMAAPENLPAGEGEGEDEGVVGEGAEESIVTAPTEEAEPETEPITEPVPSVDEDAPAAAEGE